MSSKFKKTRKVKAMQQKKKLFRANEPLLSVFMWGVNYSVSPHVQLRSKGLLGFYLYFYYQNPIVSYLDSWNGFGLGSWVELGLIYMNLITLNFIGKKFVSLQWFTSLQQTPHQITHLDFVFNISSVRARFKQASTSREFAGKE